MVLADNDASNGQSQQDRIHIIIYVFLSIALYNVVELVIRIATTFRRFRGLYCWSFLVATWGIGFNAVGYLLRALPETPSSYVYTTITLVGWISMVTGQSLVLYSRLHIVLHWENFLRGILVMIIANAIWLSIPIAVLVYLSNSPNSVPYLGPYSIFEKLQLTVFFVQETLISAIYVAETCKILRSYSGLADCGRRGLMSQLILINVSIVVLDISILCLQFSDHYDLQTAWKPLVYSIKLKMEFSVLNRLVELSQHVRRNRGLALIDTPPVDATGLPLDLMVDDGRTLGGISINETPSYSRTPSSAGHKCKASQPDAKVSAVHDQA